MAAIREKGSYVLILQLPEARRITIGKLGEFDFPAGYYLYFGSALKGLDARIRRHLTSDKKLHWHIDYLRSAASVRQVWRTTDDRRWECCWAGIALSLKAEMPALGFGSSDCRCSTHLAYAREWEGVERLKKALAKKAVLQVSG